MYKAFLVDDEALVRNGLKKHFNWAKHLVSLEGEAADGKEALAFLLKHPVDILITDVRMPFMNGIELTQQIKEIYPAIKVVFISGYEDVEYLKSALKMDAVDYILKSIDLDEFAEAIDRIVNMLEKEKGQHKLMLQMEHKLMQSIPLLQEKFLVSLVCDELDDAQEAEKRSEFLNLNLSNTSYYCILILRLINYFSSFAAKSEKDKQLFSCAVLNICREISDKYYCGALCFENQQGEFVFILSCEGDNYESTLLTLVDELQKALDMALGFSTEFGISQQFSGLAGIRNAYMGAKNSINRGYKISEDITLSVDKFTSESNRDKNMADFEKALINALNSGNAEKVDSLLTTHVFPELSNHQEPFRRNAMIHLLMLPETAVYPGREKQKSEYSDMHTLLEEYLLCRGINEEYDFIRKKYREVSILIGDSKKSYPNIIVAQIKDIISKRYMQPVTILEIASEIYLTPTYLCVLFKHETGQTINEYLTNYRITKAKTLLHDPQLKIYHISQAVGYNSLNHFTRLFKKNVGVTPGEYRSTVISQKQQD